MNDKTKLLFETLVELRKSMFETAVPATAVSAADPDSKTELTQAFAAQGKDQQNLQKKRDAEALMLKKIEWLLKSSQQDKAVQLDGLAVNPTEAKPIKELELGKEFVDPAIKMLTAFSYAATFHFPPLLELFIQYGMVTQKSTDVTPVMASFLTTGNYMPTLCLLLDRGLVSVNSEWQQDNNGKEKYQMTALHLAVKGDQLPTTRVLLAYGADERAQYISSSSAKSAVTALVSVSESGQLIKKALEARSQLRQMEEAYVNKQLMPARSALAKALELDYTLTIDFVARILREVVTKNNEPNYPYLKFMVRTLANACVTELDEFSEDVEATNPVRDYFQQTLLPILERYICSDDAVDKHTRVFANLAEKKSLMDRWSVARKPLPPKATPEPRAVGSVVGAMVKLPSPRNGAKPPVEAAPDPTAGTTLPVRSVVG